MPSPAPPAPGSTPPTMRYGAARCDITPPAGTRFGGFWEERPEPALGAHDPLWACALVVEGEDASAAALVSLDLQLISRPAVEEIRARVRAATGIAPERVLVHATHDHAAPGGHWSEAFVPGAGDAFADPPVAEQIVTGAARAVENAWRALTPGSLRCAQGEVAGIGRYRHAPDGPPTSPAAVVRLGPASGRTAAVVASYGCHASVLGPDNLWFSADYPGAVRARLAAAFGAEEALFFNAPAADVSTRHTRRAQTFGEVERLGARLAGELAALGERASPLSVPGVKAQVGEVALALAPAAEADGLYARLRARLPGDRVGLRLQLLALGDLWVLGVEAEVGHALGRDLLAVLRAAGARAAFVVAPAGGSVGNVPSPLFSPDAGLRLVEGARTLAAGVSAPLAHRDGGAGGGEAGR
ncbi:MAG: neutral/alkaline non-lysosomal ceramidase N-terminal domain-containing protein [Firmicutes bacterium]|nr:neutral/alkaline non-lysosomal ceramidase N-terminal domain-containing protein [Bacillota bacterium]